MEFKKEPLKLIFLASLLGVFLLGLMIWKSSSKADSLTSENTETLPPIQDQAAQEVPLEPFLTPELDASTQDDAAIQEQLNKDREEQKQTKYLKTQLEQTNLELEQEKALAEINKLKMENRGSFKEPAVNGEKDMPEVIVEYIGGDSVKKEAILSIAGSSYQVKEKSSPTDDIQVMSISDSSVTLHFSAPQELTKIIDYKPE